MLKIRGNPHTSTICYNSHQKTVSIFESINMETPVHM